MMQRRDPHAARIAAAQAHFKIALRDPATGLWLHMSGKMTTAIRDWAWTGTRAQGRNIRAVWLAGGHGWPFKVVAKSEMPGMSPASPAAANVMPVAAATEGTGLPLFKGIPES